MRTTAGGLRRDTRAVGRATVFGLLGILVVGVAVFLAFGGPALDGDTDPPTEGDAAPSDGEDESEPNDSESDTNNDDETDGEDGSDGEDDGDSDSGEDEAGNNEDTSDDGGEDNSGGENETENLVDIAVDLDAADRDTIDEGDGTVFVYNMTSEEQVMQYDFSNGGEFTIPDATPKTTYELVVNLSYYPEESIRHSPRLSGTLIEETVGYGFQGADSYEMDWEVDVIATGDDIDDEDPLIVTAYGYSVLDLDENYYTTWDQSDATLRYFYLAKNNVTYWTGTDEVGNGWGVTNSDFSDPSNTRDVAVREGIGGVNRTYLREESSLEYHELHVYRVSEEFNGSPFIAHIDPDTGYVVYTEIIVEELDDPDFTRDVAEISSHDEAVSAIPDDFPIEKIEEELEDH